MGARKQGIFSQHFLLKNVVYPDGVTRNSAVRGTLVDVVEWISYFPSSNIIRYALLCYRLCAEPMDLYEAFMELFHQYQEQFKISETFLERCYVFVVQWILLWGGQDFTPDLRTVIMAFSESVFKDFRSGTAIEHIQGLLAADQVLQSYPGDSSDLEKLEDDEVALSSRSKRKRISRVITLPLAMLSPREPAPADLGLLEVSSEILCSHLSCIEMDFFRSVKVTEFLRNNWLKSNRSIVAPSLSHLSDHFNKVSLWVASLVLHAKTMKLKIRLLAKFLRMVKVRSSLTSSFNRK